MKKSFIIILCAATAIVSCEKTSTFPVRYGPAPTNTANIKFLALSPDAPQVNFFTNGQKTSGVIVTSGPAIGVSYPSVLPATIGYYTVAPGTVTIEAKVPDSSTVTPGAIISTSSQTLAANKFYTYAVYDSMSKIKATLLEDDLSIPDTSKSYIRLANFVSNTPNVRIEVATRTGFVYPFPVLFTQDLAIGTATAFQELQPPNSYIIYLKNATTGAKLDSISTFTPSKSRKYTIYTRGVFGLTGTNTRRPIITSFTHN